MDFGFASATKGLVGQATTIGEPVSTRVFRPDTMYTMPAENSASDADPEMSELVTAVDPLAAIRRSVREESTVSRQPVAHQTTGVAVQVLATVDLGGEIEGMEGRQLRMRMVTIEPAGVFGPIHDHAGRPGVVYVLQGTITDHRDGVATDYGPGLGWPEDRNTSHWLENRGTVPAVEISIDIVGQA